MKVVFLKIQVLLGGTLPFWSKGTNVIHLWLFFDCLTMKMKTLQSLWKWVALH